MILLFTFKEDVERNQSQDLPEWVDGRVTASHKIGTTQTTAQVD